MSSVGRFLRAVRVVLFGREDAGPGGESAFRGSTAAAQEARDEAESRRMDDWDRTTAPVETLCGACYRPFSRCGCKRAS